MARKLKDPDIIRVSKIVLDAGLARPGQKLASFQISMVDFCRQFNDQTKHLKDEANPVPITVTLITKKGKKFDFKLGTPTTSYLIKKATKLEKGSSKPGLEPKGFINKEQLYEIAKTKLPDLNCSDLDTAVKIIAASAKSMGLEIKDEQIMEAKNG